MPDTGGKRMPTVGFLLACNDTDWGRFIDAFTTHLNQLNPGANPTIKYVPPRPNGADGDSVQIQAAAHALATDAAVDVIVTTGTGAALALKQETQANSKPFIFASVGDAAISGLLPWPGGNFSGGSNG